MKWQILNSNSQVPNGLNLIHGPFGSGKTVLVALLAGSKHSEFPNPRHLSPAVPTAVVPEFMGTKSKLMIVRAHGLSLEKDEIGEE